MSGKSKLFLGLGVGIWTGVALGMLIAPKSAKDIRHIAKCLSAALMGSAAPSAVRDLDADAVYIRFNNRKVKHTVKLDANRLVDFDAENVPVAVDLLSVSCGVELSGLPNEEGVAKELSRWQDIKVLTPSTHSSAVKHS